ISSLVERISSIGRLVNFVQVLQRHQSTLVCESISLGKMVFKYGHSTAHPLPEYRATVDFSIGDHKILLLLEKGNPHLRIIDYLKCAEHHRGPSWCRYSS